MTEAPLKKSPAPWLALLAAALVPLLLDSCSSTSKIQGLPDKLPEIALNGSAATPPHHMQSYEYPFDANGNYVSAWAAEGERRAGRSAMATDDDERKWSNSHRGHATGKPPKKATGKSGSKSSGKSGSKSSGKSSGKSSKKKSTSSDDDKPKTKSKSGSGSKSSSSGKKSSGTKSGSGTSKKKSSSGSSSDKPKPKSGTKSSSSKSKKKSSDD